MSTKAGTKHDRMWSIQCGVNDNKIATYDIRREVKGMIYGESEGKNCAMLKGGMGWNGC